MVSRISCSVIMLSLAALAGCGGAKPASGGTTGTLRIGGDLLSDIQVTVYRVEGSSTRHVGFGVTDAEGTFELMTKGARGELWLTPGEYRFTLESAGAPVQIPDKYSQPDTTPLKASWSVGDEELKLDVPDKLLATPA